MFLFVQEVVQLFVYLRPDGSGGVFFLFTGCFNRDDHVSFHLEQLYVDLLGNFAAPPFLNSQVASVYYDGRGAFRQLYYSLRWISVLDYGFDTSFFELFGRFGQTRNHELVVPQVGSGEVVRNPEVGYHW